MTEEKAKAMKQMYANEIKTLNPQLSLVRKQLKQNSIDHVDFDGYECVEVIDWDLEDKLEKEVERLENLIADFKYEHMIWSRILKKHREDNTPDWLKNFSTGPMLETYEARAVVSGDEELDDDDMVFGICSDDEGDDE